MIHAPPERFVCLVLALLVSLASCSDSGPRGAPLPGDPEVSLLALGDTGKQHRFAPQVFEGQLAVASALVGEDEREPVDAVVLLGDNFYEDGLREQELAPRIHENLVLPYCHFLSTSAPRFAEVAGTCTGRPPGLHEVPIYAVLGNHDLRAPESASLQRRAVPQFVANWHVPDALVETVEIGGEVSLILFDSEAPPTLENAQELVRAVEGAAGPWRVVAAHRPVSVWEDGGPLPFPGHVRNALAQSDVPVHAFLSGHNHNMQVIRLGERSPALHVVVGSGSRALPLGKPHADREFAAERLGFARLDVSGSGGAQRLFVSLFATAPWPILQLGPPELVARWSIDAAGTARDELADPATSSPPTSLPPTSSSPTASRSTSSRSTSSRSRRSRS